MIHVSHFVFISLISSNSQLEILFSQNHNEGINFLKLTLIKFYSLHEKILENKNCIKWDNVENTSLEFLCFPKLKVCVMRLAWFSEATLSHNFVCTLQCTLLLNAVFCKLDVLNAYFSLLLVPFNFTALHLCALFYLVWYLCNMIWYNKCLSMPLKEITPYYKCY